VRPGSGFSGAGVLRAGSRQRRRLEQRSLFGEILDWMLAPLLLLWPMSLALTWLAAQGIASKPYDRSLIAAVHVLAQRLEPAGPRLGLSLSRETAQVLRADESDSIFYQVRGPRGEWIAGDRDLPPPPADTAGSAEVRLRDDAVQDEDVRVAYQWVSIVPDQPPALVQVGETLSKRSRLATEIVKGVILPQFVVLPIGVLLVWMALARGLSPLAALQQRIRERPSDDLSPIDERQVPEEVAPLVQAINELLARQQAALATQKRFLADAAHQLKTPLAGLRMQAELAAREIDAGHGDPQHARASLVQIANASQRAAHVVNQLLSMARADARAADAAHERIDLDRLATEVVRDFVPRAMDKAIDLGYEGPTLHEPDTGAGLMQRLQGRTHDAPVLGHALLLRELITNLVDNALQYTPRGGTVTVRVMPDPFGQVVLLQVEDSGPGIPLSERELVFQPFYRPLGTPVEGSGLGLAIVAEIARQHGAQVTLEDTRGRDGGQSPGLCASLRFRRAPAPA